MLHSKTLAYIYSPPSPPSPSLSLSGLPVTISLVSYLSSVGPYTSESLALTLRAYECFAYACGVSTLLNLCNLRLTQARLLRLVVLQEVVEPHLPGAHQMCQSEKG